MSVVRAASPLQFLQVPDLPPRASSAPAVTAPCTISGGRWASWETDLGPGPFHLSKKIPSHTGNRVSLVILTEIRVKEKNSIPEHPAFPHLAGFPPWALSSSKSPSRPVYNPAVHCTPGHQVQGPFL